jgi:hypothetical protein
MFSMGYVVLLFVAFWGRSSLLSFLANQAPSTGQLNEMEPAFV